MAFVLDASTALNLVLPEERSTATAQAVVAAFMRGESAQVPALWLLEVANALVVAERRERIESGGGVALLQKLLELPIQVAPDVFGAQENTVEIMRAAVEHDLSAYDSAYLCLARGRGLALATDDASLARAADAAGLRRIST